MRTTPGITLTGEELHTYCREHLAPYKTPATWVFADTLPLTASGEIRKNVLRDQLTAIT